MGNVKRKLFERLKEFYPDQDFVLGVISNAGTDENYQRIIDFMDNEEDVSVDSILSLSLLLNDVTDQQRPEKEAPC